ncbi:MAG: hypothetical protein M3409_01160 [Gemmatimonadota bacterium]|jgi:hypothetical protein|nr:hypothetical protein [Gemmatimonadota bacterium]
MPDSHTPKGVIVRDLLIFQLKLWMDGLKDVVLAPVSVGAALFDLVLGPSAKGLRLYRVMRVGERFDLRLNLFGAAADAVSTPRVPGAGPPGG